MDNTEPPNPDQRSMIHRNRWILIASAVGAVIGLTLAGGGLNHLKPLFGIDSDAVRLTEPDVVQGLARLTDPEIQRALAAAKNSYSADVESVAAAYGGTSRHPELMVHVVASKLKNPETNLDLLLADALGTTPPDATRVDAGSSGGIAQCGTGELDSGPAAVCTWVADDSFGKFIWVGASLAEAKDQFTAIRSQFES
ncbi:hypothetical protein ACFO5K_22470 [Nocardia halotolerans]|uniref:Uncharacterized protein n=1 Tax=Nocardia halotolerans TaxID=1755878 RepID=A0ABV8VLD5_9NOCA